MKMLFGCCIDCECLTCKHHIDGECVCCDEYNDNPEYLHTNGCKEYERGGEEE